MTLSRTVISHLRTELAKPDPWQLESSPYEQARYRIMLDMIGGSTFEHALEVGCAAGAFTELLAPHCKRLRVVDVLPAAIARCRRRLTDHEFVDYAVGDIAEVTGWDETYDLIVIAEVLYYVNCSASIEAIATRLGSWLRPGGTLIFGSAIDATSAAWGLPFGAESAMATLARELSERARVPCVGESPNERSLIVRYGRDA